MIATLATNKNNSLNTQKRRHVKRVKHGIPGWLFDDAKLGGGAKHGFSPSAPFCVRIQVPSKYRTQRACSIKNSKQTDFH